MEKNVDRRVQRTQKSIQDALVALMLEKSYEKITIQDIINRANIGRATFYNHYQDKDDLLLRGIAELAQEEDLQQTDTSHSPDPKLHLRNRLQTTGMFLHSQQNQKLHQVMLKRNRDNPIQEKITQIMYEIIENQLLEIVGTEDASKIPFPILKQFLTGGMLALINWWHDNTYPYTPEEMDEFVQQLIEPGLVSTLRIKEPDNSSSLSKRPEVGQKY